MSSELKRPWYHTGLIIFYSLLPVISILIYAIALRIPLIEFAVSLFEYFNVFSSLLLFTSPFIALSLFYVNKNSFYVFSVHNILLAIYAVTRIVEAKSFLDIIIAIVYLFFASSILLIFHKNFRQPYFNLLPRGFRTNKRQYIQAPAKVNNENGMVTNLSYSGCFFQFENGFSIDNFLKLGQQVNISIDMNKRKINRIGEVMRLTLNGVGIRFLEPLAEI